MLPRTLVPASFAAAALLTAASALGQVASFQPLAIDAPPFAVSGNGNVVIGINWSTAQLYRWTPETGATPFAPNPFGVAFPIVTALSTDGSVAVGANIADTPESFPSLAVWTGTEVTSYEPPPEFTGSSGTGVSGNGAIVVGDYSNPGNACFRRDFAQNSTDLFYGLTGVPGDYCHAAGVTRDGNRIVGESQSATHVIEATYWDFGGPNSLQPVSLGVIARGTPVRSHAFAVSADGSVIVGSSAGREIGSLGVMRDYSVAFRWTQATGMVPLGTLPAVGDVSWSDANDVSADGQVVVGSADVALEGRRHIREAFIWDSTNGMRRLYDALVAAGVTSVQGWVLQEVIGISDDGTVIVGYGNSPSPDNMDPDNADGWIAVLPRTVTPPACRADFNTSGAVDVADIFSFLSAWFAQSAGSDFNTSGATDVADIFAFLSSWFAGCP